REPALGLQVPYEVPEVRHALRTGPGAVHEHRAADPAHQRWGPGSCLPLRRTAGRGLMASEVRTGRTGATPRAGRNTRGRKTPMRIGKWRYLAPAAALVLMASACASEDDDQAQDQEAAAELAAEDLNPADRDDLQDGGDFVWALSEYEDQHNMAHVQGNKGDVGRVISATMPNATRYDEEGNYEPREEYVLDYGVSDDGLEISYELNPEAEWSNGEPITWEDYEANAITRSGQRDGDFELGSTVGYERIDSVEQGDDEYSFTIHMDEPFGD